MHYTKFQSFITLTITDSPVVHKEQCQKYTESLLFKMKTHDSISLYLRKTASSNRVSDVLHLRAVRICPAVLKSLSTAALLGNAALYLRNAVATRGNAVNVKQPEVR